MQKKPGTLVIILYILSTNPLSQAARSDGSLTLDGLQGQYAPQDPPDPGYIFVTPKRATGKSLPLPSHAAGRIRSPPTLTLSRLLPRTFLPPIPVEGQVRTQFHPSILTLPTARQLTPPPHPRGAARRHRRQGWRGNGSSSRGPSLWTPGSARRASSSAARLRAPSSPASSPTGPRAARRAPHAMCRASPPAPPPPQSRSRFAITARTAVTARAPAVRGGLGRWGGA
jgi:hypothetical protein